MKKKLNYLCILLSLLMLNSIAFPQEECGTTELSTSPVLLDYGGYLKPERTDLSNGVPSSIYATFKMLFVFVQFPNEDPNSQSSEWPIGQPPIYANQLFSPTKILTGDYWDRYSGQTQFFSDYYMEVSRGKLDVTGITRNIILDYSASYYKSFNTQQDPHAGYNIMLDEIYYKLYNDQINPIDWGSLDQWRRTSTGLFENVPEGYIDMIGIFFRTIPVTELIYYDGAAGYVPLWGNETTLPNGKKFGPNRNEFGSGFICKGWTTGPNAKLRNFGIAIHEIGHYLYENIHSTSGIMTSRGGISINDFFYSGFERMKLGYINTNTVDWDTPEYQLDDVTGREGTTNLMMKVPINSNEFFLIENRRKVSEYDIYMLGDTAGFNQLIDAVDKGKGVYIYHSMNGLSYADNVDLECADGLWNWTNQGVTTPDWSSTQQVPIIARSTACSPVSNDDSYWGSYNNKDGVSSGTFFSLGKRHIQTLQLGTVIKYTNTPEWYTSRELWGDRYDAWNIGYNEVFSPYSNPNTKSLNNSNSGIFIYYHSLVNNKANISIYKAGEGGLTEDDILYLTPPSKPMGIQHNLYYINNGTWCIPQITWYHNLEPDMERGDDYKYKKYQVYRASAGNMTGLPNEENYTLIQTVDIPVNVTPHFEDYSVLEYDCGYDQVPPFGVQYPIRYRVKAIDKFDDPSVYSDYVYTTGLDQGPGIDNGGDNARLRSNTPKEFKLNQNYPNPFNPITNIKYDLPKDVFVSIKVYDLLGREIKTLVNEYKQAGSYLVSFNGSEFASGIYFYRIEAGNFLQVKKMLLIK